MTTKEARKLLGTEADNISDEQLQKEIDTANLFKNAFFDYLRNRKNDF